MDVAAPGAVLLLVGWPDFYHQASQNGATLMPVFASASASGGGAGTVGDPYTLKEACAAVNANDIVYCRGGNYTGIRGDGGANDPFVDLPNGTGSNRTLIRPYENEVVNLFPAQNYVVLLRMPSNSNRIRFQDIIFNGNVSSPTSQAMITGFQTDSTAFWEFYRCSFLDTYGVCIQTSATEDMKFIDCIWRRQHMVGALGSYCIYPNGGTHRLEVAGCLFEDNDSYMIHHYSSVGEASDCRYYNNTFKRWGTVEGAALHISNGTGNWAWNNLFIDGQGNSQGAIEIDWNPTAALNTRSAIIAHNAGYNTGLSFIRFGQSAVSPNLIINNIGIGASNFVVNGGEQTPTFTTNLWQIDSGATAGETWEDAPNNNFAIKAGSAAIGAGTYNANVPTDRNGIARANPSPDIGPYEFGAPNPPINHIPDERATQVSVAFSFADFNVSHDGDLDRVIIYPEKGILS